MTPLLLLLLGACPIVDRGSPTDGVTTITPTMEMPCMQVDPWIGWECRQITSAANEDGPTYALDLRWNRVGQSSVASCLWLRGSQSTEFHREMPLARAAQDALAAEGVRTIELRFLGAGTRTFPANGLPNIAAVLADVWEYVVAEGIAEGTRVHVGSSMGGTQCAAALAYHGLEEIIAGAVLCGGPFWSDLAATCTDGESPVYGTPEVHADVDAWTYTDLGSTPCQDETAEPSPAWGCRSILGPEADADYSGHRIAVVLGTADMYHPWIGAEVDAYLGAVSADETLDEPSAGHTLWMSGDGAAVALARIREIAYGGALAVPERMAMTWGQVKARYR